MPIANLKSKRVIDSIKPPSERFAIYWDKELKGFGLRVMASGIKTFILDYRDKHRRQYRKKIGRYGRMAPAKARKKAGAMLRKIDDGVDPFEELEAERRAMTLQKLADEYIAHRCAEKKSGREDERIIRRELVTAWGKRRAKNISRGDVMKLTDDIKARGASIMANRTLAVVRRLFNWGIDRELVETNPAARVTPPAKERSRERVLENEEIKTLWSAIDTFPGEIETTLALKLILVTAQRPGEVTSLAWEEIDADDVWTIPEQKSKNARAHRVPLSPLALEILSVLPRRDAGPVFPSPRDPNRPITRAALARMVNRGGKSRKIPAFTPHDLRRTAASKMAAMGVSRLVISRILNHAERGVTAVYDRHGYDAEKKAALNAWSSKLRDIIEERETKIVPLVR